MLKDLYNTSIYSIGCAVLDLTQNCNQRKALHRPEMVLAQAVAIADRLPQELGIKVLPEPNTHFFKTLCNAHWKGTHVVANDFIIAPEFID